MVIGVNVPYAPNEFKNSDGEIVGFDVDLMNAVARTPGLVADYRDTAFESIIPSVQGGDFNVGMSVTDTAEREAAVDFVTYFEAGTLWAQRPGSSVDPDASCGLKVGVAYGVIQETNEIPAKSDECVAAGLAPIEKVVYTSQDEVTAALINGEVDAMSADSPATGFAIKLSRGQLEPAGEVFDSAPCSAKVQLRHRLRRRRRCRLRAGAGEAQLHRRRGRGDPRGGFRRRRALDHRHGRGRGRPCPDRDR